VTALRREPGRPACGHPLVRWLRCVLVAIPPQSKPRAPPYL